MVKKVASYIQRSLSKSPATVNFFVLLRNQCNMVIQCHLSNYSDSSVNGENLITDAVSGECFSVIDVGANKGDWTNYFIEKNPSAKMLLFEPSAAAYHHLLKEFSSNPNIRIDNEAVSDSEGETYFFEEDDMGETSSLVSTFSNTSAKKTLVKITTIDKALERHHLNKVDFLKIDAEGYDLHVLKGAANSLAQQKIKYVQFEYNAPWAEAGSTLIDAFNFLKQHGYETFLINQHGLYKLNYKKYGEYFRYSNYFATPVTNTGAIAHLVKGDR